MTWRAFWFAWGELQIVQLRTRLEHQTWQLYLALLTAGVKQANTIRQQQEATDQRTLWQFARDQAAALPRSIRPLLVPRAAAPAAQGIEAIINQFPPGDPRRAFFAASAPQWRRPQA